MNENPTDEHRLESETTAGNASRARRKAWIRPQVILSQMSRAGSGASAGIETPNPTGAVYTVS